MSQNDPSYPKTPRDSWFDKIALFTKLGDKESEFGRIWNNDIWMSVFHQKISRRSKQYWRSFDPFSGCFRKFWPLWKVKLPPPSVRLKFGPNTFGAPFWNSRSRDCPKRRVSYFFSNRTSISYFVQILYGFKNEWNILPHPAFRRQSSSCTSSKQRKPGWTYPAGLI